MAGENEIDAVAQLAKTSEGIVLGLGALHEVLQKMHAYLEKNDARNDDDEDDDDEDDKVMKAWTQSVVATVVKQVMDLNSDKALKVGGTKWPMSSDTAEGDGESAAKIRTKTEELQKPIQAQDAGAAEYPANEDEKDEDEEERRKRAGYSDREMKMAKELAELRGQFTALQNSIPGQVQKESETRLRKMGFREERGLVNPRPIPEPLGLPTDVPIRKSASQDEVVEELSKLSWRDLRRLQIQVQNGQTAGVPRELLG